MTKPLHIRKCARCGAIFQPLGQGKVHCYDCLKAFDDMFIIVREYIYDHPEDRMGTIVEKTGVDEKVILQFLREGRLKLGPANVGLLRCESCGVPIDHGKFCTQCVSQLSRAFQSASTELTRKTAAPSAPERSSNKRHSDVMHTFRDK